MPQRPVFGGRGASRLSLSSYVPTSGSRRSMRQFGPAPSFKNSPSPSPSVVAAAATAAPLDELRSRRAVLSFSLLASAAVHTWRRVEYLGRRSLASAPPTGVLSCQAPRRDRNLHSIRHSNRRDACSPSIFLFLFFSFSGPPSLAQSPKALTYR
ncbi:hypothetical protein CGRA01v4_01241 [Colletotrichum graminicola]|nr:hypothetical protein CGRA01v4_01241 [Colletotrichum graminicola]